MLGSVFPATMQGRKLTANPLSILSKFSLT
jgi:hypothetical protein